jgi:hypothetical protein
VNAIADDVEHAYQGGVIIHRTLSGFYQLRNDFPAPLSHFTGRLQARRLVEMPAGSFDLCADRLRQPTQG